MEIPGVMWTPAYFAIALFAPLAFFHSQQRKRAVLPALLLTLPLLPAYFVLHAQIPSASIRAILSFTLCWLIPNRLLLLCFHAWDSPAWSFSNPSHFLLSVLLPIRVKGPASSSANGLFSHIAVLLFELLAIACVAYCLLNFPVYARHPLFFLSAYLTVDLPSRIAAIPFHVLYGVELHPVFNNPWLPNSVAEFWGGGWNLVANGVLRQTVYNPIVSRLSARKERRKDDVARRGEQKLELWVRIVGVCATFLYSGLIHELVWFCILQERRWASWENTWFFMLHGLVASAEISFRRLLPRLSAKIPGFLKLACTLAFVHITMAWLLFAPQKAMPDF